MEYKNRIVDAQLDLKLESFGAALIVGQRAVGKLLQLSRKQKASLNFKMKSC
ncbi:hypothetical protein [Traorella massiliensis]|uniref:hypothetical protein n=1 Tax=Traorella massiliensis TaxID=1903263 RepID=UPI00248E8ADF|nr:hypothetical protein [Traorella massiliensis]